MIFNNFSFRTINLKNSLFPILFLGLFIGLTGCGDQAASSTEAVKTAPVEDHSGHDHSGHDHSGHDHSHETNQGAVINYRILSDGTLTDRSGAIIAKPGAFSKASSGDLVDNTTGKVIVKAGTYSTAKPKE